jgi:signal transduction histidine kinase
MLTNPNSGELNPKQQGYVRIISDVTADMVELVDTLLNISRIEVGKIAVELVATNVQALTESILTELSAQIEKKKLNIVRQYNDMFTGIQSDQRLLRIVIHNLITNAVKYTPDGGTISVAFKIEQNRNQIVVSDTGYGIPKNQQDKIFTKMFRADNVKDISSAQSTGLGLYMVKSLMANMGGDISFQSEENKGSSFTITL